MIFSFRRAAARNVISAGVTVIAVVSLAGRTNAQVPGAQQLVGRWDLKVRDANGRSYPSWLEVTVSGTSTLVGRFVGRTGSARPISRVELADGVVRFSIPPQWDREKADLRLEARVEADSLVGTVTLPNGAQDSFTATRSPRLQRAASPSWGQPISLFNGKDLDGWTAVGRTNGWRVIDGVLTIASLGANLVTTQKFNDFKLHVEFRYPKGGNSGVYLRGRYEVQIEDTPAREWPEDIDLGAVYGFLTPNQSAGARPNEWQSFDITLVGRRVTVVLNGRTIIADQIIPGITGGALDSDEAAPGPILLQGDHTAVEFRSIVLTPAKPAS